MINVEDLRQYCLQKKGCSESFPFDEVTLVFKAGTALKNKIFALTSLERNPQTVNLKCDPERAIELREHYEGIVPGYHMNKQHWNTVQLESDVPDQMLLELIDHSYDLIVASLPKKIQNEL